MSKISRDVQQAVDDSMARAEIVTLDYSGERAAELLALCDDCVKGEGRIEFWADADSQGDESMSWRVHLDLGVLS